MSAATFDKALSALDTMRDNAHPGDNRGKRAAHIASEIRKTLECGRGGTMRAWMESHDSQAVETVQIHNETGTTWTPLGRVIDALKPSSVAFIVPTGERSIREYAGKRVLHMAPDSLIVADDWHTIFYTVTPAEFLN